MFKYLINKRKVEVVLFGGLIQASIDNADSSTILHFNKYKFIMLVFATIIPNFLGTT